MTKRPLWQRPIFLIFVLFVILAATSRYLLASASIGEAMRVHITGLPQGMQKKVRVIVMGHDSPYNAYRIPGTWYFHFAEASWIEGLLVKMPEKDIGRIEKIEITFGAGEPVTFTGARCATGNGSGPSVCRFFMKSRSRATCALGAQ